MIPLVVANESGAVQTVLVQADAGLEDRQKVWTG